MRPAKPKQQARGDAVARRHIAQWRRITARLQVLMNNTDSALTLAGEAHSLQRQCERLASDLQTLAAQGRRFST
jgi:hypothetical protein